jgi:hypothetical protein
MAPPTSLTDGCLLASIWDDAGTTRHATPHRRTPATNFEHLGRQTSLNGSRDKSRAPSSPHTATRLPDNLDRTFQILYASKCSIIISVSIDPTTRSGRHLRNNLREGVVWQPRTRRWTRSSDAKSKNRSHVLVRQKHPSRGDRSPLCSNQQPVH